MTAIAAEDVGATTQTTHEPGEETDVADAQTMVEAEPGSDGITDPGTMTGLTARRRRRRRRRGRGRPEDEARDGESTPTPAAREDAPKAEKRAQGEDGEDEGDGNRRRRRRRGGRRRGRGNEGSSESPAPSPKVVHVSQDQIVIDIDETELEVVRDEFGEIDELDDLTLKGRRRGVMDALQDEVELEDLSDADRNAADSDDGDDAETDENGDEGADEDSSDGAESDDPSDGDDEAATDATSSESEDPRELKKRKRRRRRRKKKTPPPPPELTAPPHKDFWEVWATRFTYQDFEDDAYLGGTAAVPDEPEPAPLPTPPQMPSIDEEDTFVRVRLNVGRKHGKKAAHLRELLAESFGLARKAVRDLTVGEASSRFRLGAKALVKLEGMIVGFVFDGIELAVTRLDPMPEQIDAPAEQPRPETGNAESSDAGGSEQTPAPEETTNAESEPAPDGELAPTPAPKAEAAPEVEAASPDTEPEGDEPPQ